MPILEKEVDIYPASLLDAEPTDDGDRRWWVIHTKARQEKAICRQLFRSGSPFYLPLVPKDNLIRGRTVRGHLPLFPSYVFLFGANDERRKALETNRVARVISVDDGEQLRANLRNIRLLIASGAPVTIERRITTGHQVRIKSGALRGVEGTVLKRQGRTRVVVSIDFLQQGASVEIGDFQVELV